MHLGYQVSSIDRASKSLTLSNGDKINYDKLLLATGSSSRLTKNEGSNLPGVFTLRSSEDQAGIKSAAAKANNIVVVGAGFIGSEVTAALAKQYKGKVSMVYDVNVPLELILGYDVGASLLNEHQKNGVKTYNNRDLSKISYKAGKDGRVSKVVLDNGYELPADLVVIGAGAIPNIELAKEAGLELDPKVGGVQTNPFLQTSDNDIFAAGDIAAFPLWFSGQNVRIEHWNVAQDTGSFAAFNMLGKMTPYGTIPFFWTRHYDKSVQYVGYARSWDSIHIDGDPRANKFLALYIKDNKVVAAAAQQRGADLLTILEGLQQAELPPADQLIADK